VLLFDVLSCFYVFRVFEEKKAFLERSKLKGQFGRKAASNEFEHKYLGSSALAEGLSASALERKRTRIEHRHARSHKGPRLSALVL
jgi:hypothetical protein